ncbi:ThiF family adenylyltransferase [Streptomyces sp. DH37]|uniref:HesA/MoeB/ThiF family protein n=1 Tax=Streptomyces sp. DH37 TaxID=3040122 RepID=UPI002441D6B9|nr:ThiF family adenylyltransferase [Streptomyces sp. DH37]MDG9703305.1 ThiF family adenylyltransferase [Streptomyces sp. DH37]
MADPWGVRLRPEVRVNRRTRDGSFAFGAVSDRSWRIYKHSAWLERLLFECVDTVPLSEVFEMSSPLAPKTVRGALEALVQDRVLMWVEEDFPAHFDEVDRARADLYASRSASMAEAIAAVEALGNARIDIVGVGGLGSWTAWHAAANGIGHIVLHDADVVEARNAAYQPLCAASDAGRPKVAAVADNLRALFPKTDIRAREHFIDESSDIEELRGSDCVLGCGDEPNSEAFSLMLTRKCFTAQVPVITGGGYAGHDGRIGLSYVDGRDPCFRCWTAFARQGDTGAYVDLMPNRHPPNAVGGVTSIVSTHHVHEALKIITGIGVRELRGVVGDISTDALTPRWIDFGIDPDCPHH